MTRDLIYFYIRLEERDKLLIPLIFSDNLVIEHFACDTGPIISNLFFWLGRYEDVSPATITRQLGIWK